ncbi:iron chelate uptake ABC transporter family permease subunit, partial [Vibrio cholerae]|nr:iron chelate uptake ABC transporter family permease subunit [Vibrio cholerae]
APFLLWLLQRTKLLSELRAREEPVEHYRKVSTARVFFIMLGLLSVVTLCALVFGQGQTGWNLTLNPTLLELRAPRVLTALFAGIGLALAGTLIQRLSNNPMASPEVLGLSSGAALAIVLGSTFGIAIERDEQMLLGTLGALTVTSLIWLIGRKHNFAPSQTLLTGIALSAG